MVDIWFQLGKETLKNNNKTNRKKGMQLEQPFGDDSPQSKYDSRVRSRREVTKKNAQNWLQGLLPEGKSHLVPLLTIINPS